MSLLQLVVASTGQTCYWAAADELRDAPQVIKDLTSKDYDSFDEAREAAREAGEQMSEYADDPGKDWAFLDFPMSYSEYAELVGVSPILD